MKSENHVVKVADNDAIAKTSTATAMPSKLLAFSLTTNVSN